jgi:hypothetical protein
MRKGDTGGAKERQAVHGRVPDQSAAPLTERGQRVLKVAEQLGITTHSL